MDPAKLNAVHREVVNDLIDRANSHLHAGVPPDVVSSALMAAAAAFAEWTRSNYHDVTDEVIERLTGQFRERLHEMRDRRDDLGGKGT